MNTRTKLGFKERPHVRTLAKHFAVSADLFLA